MRSRWIITRATSKPAWITWPARESKWPRESCHCLLQVGGGLRRAEGSWTVRERRKRPFSGSFVGGKLAGARSVLLPMERSTSPHQSALIWMPVAATCCALAAPQALPQLALPVLSLLSFRVSKKPREMKGKKSKKIFLKYTAARLHEKGVLLEIEDLQVSQ